MDIGIVFAFFSVGVFFPISVAAALFAARMSIGKDLAGKKAIEAKLRHIGNKISEFIMDRFRAISTIDQIVFTPEITRDFLKGLDKWKRPKEYHEAVRQLEGFIILLVGLIILFTIISICGFVFFRESVSSKSIINKHVSNVILIFMAVNILCSSFTLIKKSARITNALHPKYLK